MAKKDLISKYQTHEEDTGSTDVQVAILSEQINDLAKHLKEHKKDFDSRVGLFKKIGQRRKLLNYLKSKNLEKYKELIKDLKLRN